MNYRLIIPLLCISIYVHADTLIDMYEEEKIPYVSIDNTVYPEYSKYECKAGKLFASGYVRDYEGNHVKCTTLLITRREYEEHYNFFGYPYDM